MTYRLGLTGSIGMGKSTTARIFADLGIPVWDADATVHKLYGLDGAATQLIATKHPAVIEDGTVSRQRLRQLIANDPGVLDWLQGQVHPLVAADRASFLAAASAPIVLLDIPLLFETGADAQCNGIIVVTASPEVQKQRVLARGEMTEAELGIILSRQMPDAEKRARATWIVETISLDAVRQAAVQILTEIRKGLQNA